MLGHDGRELAAIFVGGARAWGRSPRPITDASASTAVDSSTRQPCAAALTDTR
jgi:hypothetical protein